MKIIRQVNSNKQISGKQNTTTLNCSAEEELTTSASSKSDKMVDEIIDVNPKNSSELFNSIATYTNMTNLKIIVFLNFIPTRHQRKRRIYKSIQSTVSYICYFKNIILSN